MPPLHHDIYTDIQRFNTSKEKTTTKHIQYDIYTPLGDEMHSDDDDDCDADQRAKKGQERVKQPIKKMSKGDY